VASPTTQQADDPQKQLVDPAVKGTLNVLHSCVVRLRYPILSNLTPPSIESKSKEGGNHVQHCVPQRERESEGWETGHL